MQWYKKAWMDFTNFHGRSHRTEFWMFMLVDFIVAVAIMGIESILGIGGENIGPLSRLYSIAIFFPFLALSVRRLHDIGKRGWWVLLLLLPVIGWFIFFYFHLLNSAPGYNRYGPNPKTAVD